MNGTLRDQLADLLGAIEPSPVPVERIRRRALGIRLRRTVPVAGVLAAGVILVLVSSSPAPVSAPAPAPPASATVHPGVPFAFGVADGRFWQLAVQDIADPGYRCVPAVTVNGGDADPIGAGPGADMIPHVGDPAFITLGPALPGVGIGFVQVAPGIAAVSVLTSGSGGERTELPVTTVTACGSRFRLVGFAYPLTGQLRLDAGSASVPVPGSLSDPRDSDVYPQVTGIWQNMDATSDQLASGTLASGDAFGRHWSIDVLFGAAGDCYQLAAGSSAMAACGPVSIPSGLAAIMALPLGFGGSGGSGVGYAGLVSPATARVTARLSDGSTVAAVPHVVDGRRYAAFFVPGSARVTLLSWLNAAGATIGSTTSVAPYGVTQFQP